MKKIKLFVILSILTTGISFGSIDLDTSKIQNTTIETGKKGNTIININTPNDKGISVNDFENFQTKDGVIFNNSGQKMNISQLEGIINGNSNITKDQAKLILNRVNGVNRAEIESTLEAVGKDKADMIFSSPNGIYLNGTKFIGFKDVTFTTAPVGLDTNGNIQNLVIEKGNIEIGKNGLDASKLEQIALLSRYLNVDGEIKGKDINIITGNYTYDINNKKILNKNETIPTDITISSSDIGSIYGNQINIIVTDGNVALKGDIIANDNIVIDIMNGGGLVVKSKAEENIVINHKYFLDILNMDSDNNILIKAYAIDNEDGRNHFDGGLFHGHINAKNLFFTTDKELTGSASPYTNLGNMQIENLYLGGNLVNRGSLLVNNIIKYKDESLNKYFSALTNRANLIVLNDMVIDSFYNESNSKATIFGNINLNRLENSGQLNIENGFLSANSFQNKKNGIIFARESIFGHTFRNEGELTTTKDLIILDSPNNFIEIFKNSGKINARNISIAPSKSKINLENYGILNAEESINIEANRLLNAGEINTKKLNLSFKDYSSQGGKITADQITFNPYVD